MDRLRFVLVFLFVSICLVIAALVGLFMWPLTRFEPWLQKYYKIKGYSTLE